MEYTKNCPKCGNKQIYQHKYSLFIAIKNNTFCKKCSQRKRYPLKTKKEIKQIKDDRTEYMKEYRIKYDKNPENKKRRRIKDKKRSENPKFKISKRISLAIRNSLISNNLSKNGRHWEDLVGYTSQKLKDHLESLFQPGMTWNNYGKWHVDHIIPKSFFIYSSTDDVEFRYCWSLNNLQPLWAKDNLKKGNKIKNPLLL